MPDLILASASPRRRELLSLTGLTFSIDAAEVDEHTDLGAREAVQELCRLHGVAAMTLHAKRQSFQTDIKKEAVHGSGDGSEVAHQL